MTASAIFGGGCFWCIEAIFQRLKGVTAVTSGYTGGKRDAPTYDMVSTGISGHAEVVKVEYDPAQVSFDILLTVFFASHDPTTPNRQGHDVGTQYRLVIYCTTPEQEKSTRNFIVKLTNEKTFASPIVTEVEQLDQFHAAEAYHQNYYNQNSDAMYCQAVISPKLAKLRAQFSHLLK